MNLNGLLSKKDLEEVSNDEPQELIILDEPKRKRGRPRKKSKNSNSKSKKRGRPPKNIDIEIEEVSEEEYDEPPKKLKVKKTKSKSKSKLKQILIYKILKYQENPRFKETIQEELDIKYTDKQLQKMKIDELKDIIERIRIYLDNRNIDVFYDSLLKGSLSGIEMGVSKFWNIDGFQETLMNDDQFLDCFEKFKIEHELPHIPPSVQMLMIISKTMVMCNAVHKLNIKNPKKTMEPPKTPEILKDDKDDNNIGVL